MPSWLRTLIAVLLVPACFLGALQLAPQAVQLHARLFPEPSFTTGDWSALQARAGSDVVLYATSTCPYCAQARALLDKRGVAYRTYLIDETPEAQAEFARLDGRGVPLLFIGTRRIAGFREQAIVDALDVLQGQRTLPVIGSTQPPAAPSGAASSHPRSAP